MGRGLANILNDKYEIVVLKGRLENMTEWENDLYNVDIIIHLAGITHAKNIGLYKRINVEGTRDLILAAEKYAVKQFIFISTGAVGENCGAYGESKKEAEKFLRERKLTYTILRFGPTYNDDFGGKEGLASLVRLAKKSFILPYLSDDNIRFSPIHLDDVTKSIVAAVENQKAYFKTYTITGPENLSTREILYRLLKHNKTKKLFIPVPTFLARFIFYIFSNILKMAAPDQMQRLLSKKEPLSENVLTDLGVNPRKFLE